MAQDYEKIALGMVETKGLVGSVEAADAMVNFFFDHGNRENRAEARIRFMVKKMGADEFRKLFLEYAKKYHVKGIEEEI